MATTYNIFDLQVYDRATGLAVNTTGGQLIATATGAYARSTLYNPDSDYAAISGNVVSATRGKFRFAVVNTGLGSPALDVFGFAPGGHFFFVKNVKPASITDIWIDSNKLEQLAIVPFSMADATAATEKDTGLDFTTGMTIMPFTAVDVRTVDSGKTIDFGLLSSESGGDADGFVAAASVATAAVVQAKCAATATLGALLRETVVADAGTASVRHSYTIGATAVSLTYTISSGSTTAAGYMRIPYTLKF